MLRLSFFFFFGKKWNRTHDFISRHIPFLSYLRSHLCAHLPCFWMCFVVCLFFPLSDILVYTTNELDEWEILSVLLKQILQPCLYNTKTDDMGQRNISQIRSNILLGWVFTGKKSLGKLAFRMPENVKRYQDLGNARARFIKFTLRCSYSMNPGPEPWPSKTAGLISRSLLNSDWNIQADKTHRNMPGFKDTHVTSSPQYVSQIDLLLIPV